LAKHEGDLQAAAQLTSIFLTMVNPDAFAHHEASPNGKIAFRCPDCQGNIVSTPAPKAANCN